MRFDDLPPFLRIEQAQELTQLGRSQLYEQT
jgi:predicted DNA-binding transcriptional regulator AlpA